MVTLGQKIALTFDDPTTVNQPLLDWRERNARILSTLKKHSLNAALFVCGKRIDSPDGRELLSRWDSAGHLLCNHSYSHYYYHAPRIPVAVYVKDFYRGDSLIRSFAHYTRLYRYPYLKEGETEHKRDSMRMVLRENDYRNGYVTVDASDWYIDGRMVDSLRSDPSYDLQRFKEYYIAHILDRAEYYDSVARVSGMPELTHTLLLHHNLLAALFLDDLINALKANSWEIVNAHEAYNDKNYFTYEPEVVPAGESIVWSYAKERCKGCTLRHPAEDGIYEEERLTKMLVR